MTCRYRTLLLCAALTAQVATVRAATAQEGEPRTASAPARGYVNPETAPRPTAAAVKASGPIAIDGRLDEPDWQRAPVLTDFIQQLPATGMPATFRTEVRILYDRRMLYVSAVNLDPEPQKAIIAGLERDFNTGQSDIFGLALDTFHDRRNSFLWALNP
nr:carbohydrate binding family 9 domain-containing protein [Gemmatimonadaceae bacterium]